MVPRAPARDPSENAPVSSAVLLPPQGSVRVRWPRLPEARALAEAVARADFSRAAPLKVSESRSVLMARLGPAGAPLVFKTRTFPSALDLARAALGRGAFDRERRASLWLSARKFSTPVLCAHLAGTRSGRRIETLVFQGLEAPSLLSLIRDRDPLLDDVAGPLGALWARLLRSNRYLADAKPSNLLVQSGDPARADGPACRLWLVDVGSLRRLPPVGEGRALVRMIRDLSLEPIGLCAPAPERWLANVAAWTIHALVGAPPSQAFVAGIMGRVRLAVSRHPDPTPRDTPI